MDTAISVRGLRKSYGDFEAVRGIDFEVATGEVFGLLGPNGAGKTTTIEILEGLRPRTAGEVSVLGLDPERNTRAVKQRIGAALQATNLPEKIKVSEALQLFANFYDRRGDVDSILRRLQLWEKRNAFYGQLSGGQKQRVALGLALVNDPDLLFLDEPTTGLDPQVRLEIHGLIQELRDKRRTIVLTTHYIEEAERLCDRVAIVDQGRSWSSGPRARFRSARSAHSFIEIRSDDGVAGRDAARFARSARVHFCRGPQVDNGHLVAGDANTHRVGEVDRPAGAARGRHPDEAAHARRCLHRTDWKEAARMRPYLALIGINLKLAMREKAVLFFNFVLPAAFFFGFGQLMRADSGGVTQVVTMVLVFGVLGSGLYGAGLRAVAEREANILRRYKVAPITPAPLLVASMVTGVVLYLPALTLILLLAHFRYRMPAPPQFALDLHLRRAGRGGDARHRADHRVGGELGGREQYPDSTRLSADAVSERRHDSAGALPDMAAGGGAVSAGLAPIHRAAGAAAAARVAHRQSSAGRRPVVVYGDRAFVAGEAVPLGEGAEDTGAGQTVGGGGIPALHLSRRVAGKDARQPDAERDVLERTIRRNRTRLLRGARIFIGRWQGARERIDTAQPDEDSAGLYGRSSERKELKAEAVDAVRQDRSAGTDRPVAGNREGYVPAQTGRLPFTCTAESRA